jgi:N-glycosylase/DNA lyase
VNAAAYPPSRTSVVVGSTTHNFPVSNYDLAATLTSGQAFRWNLTQEGWTGVIGRHWVRLRSEPSAIHAEVAEPISNWDWLTGYLRLDEDLETILRSFPNDEPMQNAVTACRGLRLLRQDPWECLASFILSSTKQIVQIRQIVAQVCQCFGDELPSIEAGTPAYSFPAAARLAEASEAGLRACKMGFRAPNLLATARKIAEGEVNLEQLHNLPTEEARAQLDSLPGVGRKIADCVLLFAYGKQSAFPVDVWVMKALQQLYFPRRKVKLERLHRFAATHFGPNAGYAQQYLFHYMRTKLSAKPIA